MNKQNMSAPSHPPPAVPASTAPVTPKKRSEAPPPSEPQLIKLHGHVGFDALPHQLVKKATEQGFHFNLMCVGETGMGKTTLIESLFNMKLEFPPCNAELKTVNLLSKTYEGGIHLKLTIVETAGFGDQLDKEKSAAVIADYINSQFESYLKEELKIRRMLHAYEDTRIHACLYFISPTGHGLKALDVVTLRELSKRVNVIPVIAKADTTCKDELVRFKDKIMNELRAQKISIFEFPVDDDTVAPINAELNRHVPFAVVGSTDFVKKDNGKLVRARRYPWGIVEVENEEHCDFVKLREALLRTNVEALRERTHVVLYEAYRRDRLRQMRVGDGDTGPRIAEVFALKQRELSDDMAAREVKMRSEFQMKLSKKEEEIRNRDDEMSSREREIEAAGERTLKALDAELAMLLDEKTRLELKKAKKERR